MANISKIKLPDGSTYDMRDSSKVPGHVSGNCVLIEPGLTTFKNSDEQYIYINFNNADGSRRALGMSDNYMWYTALANGSSSWIDSWSLDLSKVASKCSILWANSSPSSSFSDQEIDDLKMSNYSCLLLAFLNIDTLCTYIVPTEYPSYECQCYLNNNPLSRTVTIGDDYIHVGPCIVLSSGASTDLFMIPNAIFGLL